MSNVDRVLIVDDEPIARKMLTYALDRAGFACEIACDGQEAAELLAQFKYDLVVTDLRMPNRDGRSLAIELLSQPERPVVIVHTWVDEPQVTQDLIARGVDDVIYKPMNYAVLAGRAKVLIEKRREELKAAVAVNG